MKTFLRGLCSLIFKLSVYLFAITTAIVLVFGSPIVLKQALRDSKIYGSAVDSALESLKKQQAKTEGEGEGLPIGDPAVQAAAKQAFSADKMQHLVEPAIDSIYDWLKGKTDQPDFHVSLEESKQTFITLIGQAAVQRFSSLPACTAQQNKQLAQQGGEVQPFSVNCQPTGVTLDSINQQVQTSLAANSSEDSSGKQGEGVFAGKTVYTSQDLPKDSNGQTIFQNLKATPKLFQLLLISPWIWGGLTIVCGAGLILLHDQRRRALRSIGITLVVIALFIGLSCLVANLLFSGLTHPGGPLSGVDNGTIKQSAGIIVTRLSNKFNHVLYWFTAVYAVIGVGALITLRLTRPPKMVEAPETDRSPDIPEPTHSPKTDSAEKPHQPQKTSSSSPDK